MAYHLCKSLHFYFELRISNTKVQIMDILEVSKNHSSRNKKILVFMTFVFLCIYHVGVFDWFMKLYSLLRFSIISGQFVVWIFNIQSYVFCIHMFITCNLFIALYACVAQVFCFLTCVCVLCLLPHVLVQCIKMPYNLVYWWFFKNDKAKIWSWNLRQNQFYRMSIDKQPEFARSLFSGVVFHFVEHTLYMKMQSSNMIYWLYFPFDKK